MSGKVINCYEESPVRNRNLPLEWQEQSALDELAEFLQLNWEQRAVFFDDGVISSRQQYLGFTGQKGIRTNSYVGTISFKGQQLNIFPKVFKTEKDDSDTSELDLKHLMKNLVQWIEYCNRIEYPFISISSELEESNDLRELFVTLYLHYVKSALDYRPYYRYEDREEDLSVVKGHINFSDYVRNKMPSCQSNKFKCSFSSFEFDNAVNQIIKYTCKGLAGELTSNKNRKTARYILTKLNEVSDVHCVPSSCDRIRLSKLHRQYSVILSMSKMFLLNQTTSYTFAEQDSFCFLFPTELLFEGFIGGFMSELLRGIAKVRLQASELPLISNFIYGEQSLGKSFTMRHDILVEHKTKGIFVLDTKYKNMSRFEGNEDIKKTVTDEVSQSDLYQVIEYASQRNIDSAYLLYPMYRYEDNEPLDVILERKATSGQVVNVHIVRLPFVFEDDTEKTKAQLATAINKIFADE